MNISFRKKNNIPALDIEFFRIINWVFLALSLCFALAIPVVGIGSTVANWDGMCYGFTDSQLPCSWWEFAKNEMFWNSLMFVPLTVMTLGLWGLLTITRWGMRSYWETKSIQTKGGNGI
jgi:hypothetical protein